MDVMRNSIYFRDLVLEYLQRCGMDYRSIDMEAYTGKYIEEMEAGLAGRESTLQMIPSYIRMPSDIPSDEPVIAIDAGGTNLRIAMVRFDSQKKPDITDFENFSMPGVGTEVGRDEFFDTLSGYLRKYIGKSRRIGFCFSYPVEMRPDRDGRLVYFTKEVMVRDSRGMLVAANLRDALGRAGISKPVEIALLNDTVATLLGGKAATPDRVFGAYAGFILGTGTNTAYAEECVNIVKQPELAASGGSMIINMESGGYGVVPQGTADLEMDRHTVNPGRYGFEKMVSGRYQGELALAVLKDASGVSKTAGTSRMFSEAFAQRIANVPQLTSAELDEFLLHPYGRGVLAVCCGESEEDRQFVYHIIDCLTERTAILVTINLSAVAAKTRGAAKPYTPICITAEGSTFYKSKLLRTKIDYYIKRHMNEKMGCYCEFVKADNPTITGTAIAALA